VDTLNATGVTTISNNLSVTNSGTLGVAGLATLSGGATVSGGLLTAANISNIGYNCNFGAIYTRTTLTVDGTYLSNTGNISNGGNISNLSGDIRCVNLYAGHLYGDGSGLTGISGGGGSSNLVVSNVTGTALLNAGTSPAITSNLSGVYFIINNSGFSNIYIWDYLSSGTQAGYYNVLVNQTGTSLTITTTNLNITRSGYITIPAYANATILYSPSNGYANYFVM
jgi:hypothetical protein